MNIDTREILEVFGNLNLTFAPDLYVFVKLTLRGWLRVTIANFPERRSHNCWLAARR